MKNSNYCYFHSKEMRLKHLESARKGGKTPKRVFTPLEPIDVQKAKDVVNLLITIINEVRLGKLDVRIANCLGFLSGHILKALEISDIEERMDNIEKILIKKGDMN